MSPLLITHRTNGKSVQNKKLIRDAASHLKKGCSTWRVNLVSGEVACALSYCFILDWELKVDVLGLAVFIITICWFYYLGIESRNAVNGIVIQCGKSI